MAESVTGLGRREFVFGGLAALLSPSIIVGQEVPPISPAHSYKKDYSTPEKTLETTFYALRAGDRTGFAETMHDDFHMFWKRDRSPRHALIDTLMFLLGPVQVAIGDRTFARELNSLESIHVFHPPLSDYDKNQLSRYSMHIDLNKVETSKDRRYATIDISYKVTVLPDREIPGYDLRMAWLLAQQSDGWKLATSLNTLASIGVCITDIKKK